MFQQRAAAGGAETGLQGCGALRGSGVTRLALSPQPPLSPLLAGTHAPPFLTAPTLLQLRSDFNGGIYPNHCLLTKVSIAVTIKASPFSASPLSGPDFTSGLFACDEV